MGDWFDINCFAIGLSRGSSSLRIEEMGREERIYKGRFPHPALA